MFENEEKLLKDISKKNLISKKSLLFSALLLIILVLKFLTIFLIHNIPSFAVFYTKNILNIKNGIIYSIMPYIPFIDKLSEEFQLIIMISFTVSMILFFVSIDIKPKTKKKQLSKKRKLANISIIIFSLTIFSFAYDIIEYSQMESIPNMEKTLYKSYFEKEYKIDDVEKLMVYLDKNINKYSSGYKESVINYEKQAKEDLINIKNKIPFLTGMFPSKAFVYDTKLKEIYGSNLTGLTSNYLVFYNDYLPAPISLNTVTHEFCHTKSIFKENEAVYCSYVAGINSNNDISKYGAYLEAYFRIAFAYSTFNIEKSIEYEDKYTSKCLTENKNEFCYIYGKTNKEYIDGSKYLWIKTYSLKNYLNYKEELISALTKLVNDGYHLKLEIENRNIKLDEIPELIENGSIDRIIIQESIDQKGFNRIKNTISNDKLFLAIMQMEDNDSEFSHGDALNFYLGVEENENDYVDMYTYSKIVRLLLIYHDIYGYN